jgi:hypothetical protein
MLSYTNRRNEVYYFKYTKTKNGKFRYYSTKSPEKANLEKLPDGFEIYEQAFDAIVVLRKKVERNVTPGEEKLVRNIAIDVSACQDIITEVVGDILTVYEGRMKKDELRQMLPLGPAGAGMDWLIQENQTYTPVMRFTLLDKNKRNFSVERFCYLGDIDDWIILDESDNLSDLASKYCCHIGRESYYELI